MDNVDILKSLLIFDFYNNLYNNKEQPLKMKIFPNRFKIINDFEKFSVDYNELYNKENKPNKLTFSNDKLFNVLLKNIYKRLDSYEYHESLKKNMLNDINICSEKNIYDIAFSWCKFKYY
tara:strand:- start:187 stop:546 length:360 start_codon:yes stop_codon:yes gene_type:complete